MQHTALPLGFTFWVASSPLKQHGHAQLHQDMACIIAGCSVHPDANIHTSIQKIPHLYIQHAHFVTAF